MMFLRVTERANVLACQVLLALIVLGVFIDVVMRYGMKSGLLIAGELVPYLFTWFAFLAAALCFRRNENFLVDFVLEASARLRPWLELVNRLVELGFFLTIIWFGWRIAMDQMVQSTPYLGIPYGLVYLSVPVSGLLMLIYNLDALTRLVAGHRKHGEDRT